MFRIFLPNIPGTCLIVKLGILKFEYFSFTPQFVVKVNKITQNEIESSSQDEKKRRRKDENWENNLKGKNQHSYIVFQSLLLSLDSSRFLQPSNARKLRRKQDENLEDEKVK